MQDLYGYKRNAKKRPIKAEKEAKVVKKMFEYYGEEDLSIAEICRRLEDEKIPNP
jgi:hypothetical protein